MCFLLAMRERGSNRASTSPLPKGMREALALWGLKWGMKRGPKRGLYFFALLISWGLAQAGFSQNNFAEMIPNDSDGEFRILENKPNTQQSDPVQSARVSTQIPNPLINPELVLVIDQGIDFKASESLRDKRATNPTELRGRSGIDDDNNGFVDDLSGWNILSDSPDFFPSWLSDFFTSNQFEINALVKNLLQKIGLNTYGKQLLSEISELGHGTHVAGIVARYSSDKTRILSVNLQSAGFNNSPQLLTTISKINSVDDSGLSVFDSKEQTVEVLKTITRISYKQADVLNRYLIATRPAVANLSFGSVSQEEIQGQAELLWLNYLRNAGLVLTTLRNAGQEKNFGFFVANLYRYESERWSRLFKANSNTLFVIAAGNRGKDLESEAALPANLSVNFSNVITVMAINGHGLSANFSNFGRAPVNVAAWGVDIESTIPGGEIIRMSGTSMAAPFVTALASKIRVANNQLTAFETRKIIEQSVYRIAALEKKCSSSGIINFDRALELAKRYGP